MPCPLTTRRSLWRIVGSLAIGASVAVLSSTAAFAQPSPYAYDDPTESFDFQPPFSEVAGTSQDPGPTSLVLPASQTAGDPAAPLGNLGPSVSPADLAVDPAVQPAGSPDPIQPTGLLARTGQEIIERIGFAILLMAFGLLVSEASRRRRAWLT